MFEGNIEFDWTLLLHTNFDFDCLKDVINFVHFFTLPGPEREKLRQVHTNDQNYVVH